MRGSKHGQPLGRKPKPPTAAGVPFALGGHKVKPTGHWAVVSGGTSVGSVGNDGKVGNVGNVCNGGSVGKDCRVGRVGNVCRTVGAVGAVNMVGKVN